MTAAAWRFTSANVKGRLGAVRSARRLVLLERAAALLTGSWTRRTSCQGYDFKHVTASAAPGQGSRLLQLQPASRTRVPLTHPTVYWSGLMVVVCCSGALGALTSHCQSVFCLNPQTPPFTPAFVSNSVQTGCFWLPTQVIGTFSLNLKQNQFSNSIPEHINLREMLSTPSFSASQAQSGYR